VTALELQEAVQAALAPVFSGRLYPQAAPEEPLYPYGIISTESAMPENTLCGRSDLTNYKMRIDVYSKTYVEVLTLRSGVIGAMETVAGIPLPIPTLDIDLYEPEIRAMRRVMDFSVWCKE
jgi:hypothetical protein